MVITVEKEQGRGAADNVTVVVDTVAYPVDAIHRTLYWMADKATAQIQRVEGTQATVVLTPKSPLSRVEVESTFLQGLTDFAIRVQIEERTNSIRAKIVQAAMVGATRPKAVE